MAVRVRKYKRSEDFGLIHSAPGERHYVGPNGIIYNISGNSTSGWHVFKGKAHDLGYIDKVKYGKTLKSAISAMKGKW